jgi:hypothetical protein
MSEEQQIEVDRITKQIAELISKVRQMKRENPVLRLGFYNSNYGSLLNAYREGDLSFEEAVSYMQQITDRAVEGERKRCATTLEEQAKAAQPGTVRDTVKGCAIMIRQSGGE